MYCDTWLEGKSNFRKKQLRHALFKEFVSSFDEITVFSKELREKLKEEQHFEIYTILSHRKSADTEKVLLKMKDEKKVEAVLMKHKGRNTVCVSSQVGCAADCSFCSTGKLGFTRHLSDREIIEQALCFARILKKRWHEKHPGEKFNIATVEPEYRIRNIVFMGMGEPLLNFSHVAKAIEAFESPEAMNLGVRHITVSTVGIAVNVPKFLELPRLPNLAVSLHAATNEVRDQIVPTNKGFNLEKLFAALDEFTRKTGRRVFYEWTVLPGVNDTKEQMDALGRLLEHRNAHVNFIPWNPGPSRIKYTKPNTPDIRTMQQYLEKNYGITSTIRAIYGQEMGGACGQLAGRA